LEKILVVHRTVPFTELSDNRANAAAATPRRPGSVIRVRAKLLDATPVSSASSDGSLLVQQQYEIQEVLSGQLKVNPLSVWHWARLDGKPVPSLPTQIGSTYDLRISTLLRHQETELEETLLGTAGLPSPGFLDVAPPQDPPMVHTATPPTADDVVR
jgi:hypothetical protein